MRIHFEDENIWVDEQDFLIAQYILELFGLQQDAVLQMPAEYKLQRIAQLKERITTERAIHLMAALVMNVNAKDD